MGDLRKASELKAQKEKSKASRRGVVTFEWRRFANPARSDGLELEHWVKCYKDAAGRVTPADAGEYPFAKFNKKPTVLRYSDEEWRSLLARDAAWSREETDYLLDLVEGLGLRWLVVADRYTFPGGQLRSLEDLKARYYSVARQLLVGRHGGPEGLANNVIVRHPFNAQEAEENVVLQQAQQIEGRRKAQAAKARAAAAAAGGAGGAAGAEGGGAAGAVAATGPVVVAEIGNEEAPGVPPLFDSQGEPVAPEKGATARGVYTREMAEEFIKKVQPTKAQKALEASLEELKLRELPKAPTRQVCGAFLALVNEVAALLELKRKLAAKQNAVAGAKRLKREDDEFDTPRGDKRRKRDD
eukprot:scaffold4.g4929.t1